MKKILLTLTLIINFAHANLPEGMDQTAYDAIVAQVIIDAGYFDAIAVEEGISQWRLAQPLPNTDGLLVDSGSCTTCEADDTGALAQFKQPRNVKVKAKQKADGSYPSVLKIKWKKPKKLKASIRDDYELSHYNVHISKDNTSYEILKVEPKFKRNGKLKKKQKIKFKDRDTGSYQVQVQAVYVASDTTTNTASVRPK